MNRTVSPQHASSLSLRLLARASGTAMCATLAMSTCLVSASAQSGALRAGSAKAEITPPLAKGSLPPTGKYENEHLYTRAIVLDNGTARAVLIGLDQSNVPEALWKDASERIAKDLDCPVSNIIMSGTHTHSPGETNGGEGPMVPGTNLNVSLKRISDGIVSAVHQAKGKLQPASISFGTGTIDLNVNRDAIDPKTHLWTQAPNTSAPSDKTVAVVTVRALSGAPIGVYANYAMHAINGYLGEFTSGDFPGAMSRWVENAFDDVPVAIFTQGASGDQNPLYLRPSTNSMASRGGMPITGYEAVREDVEEPLRDVKVPGKPMDPQVRDRLQRWMESEGAILGEVVIRVMTHSTQNETNVRIVGQQHEISCPGRMNTAAHTNAGPTPFVIGQPGTYGDGPAVPLRIGALTVGDIAIGSVNAEIYTLIGQRVKRESPMANTMMVTIADGRSPSGYVPDDASFSHNTFQVLASHLKVGCAEAAIPAGIAEMISSSQQAH